MPAPKTQYRGRFAPSPTGPLHLGSLIAALASFLDARHYRGVWLVRMENLDPPREEQGAAKRILDSLQCHGLHWDEPVMWQGERTSAYATTLTELGAGNHLFYCDCTRVMLGPGGACGGRCQPRQAQEDEIQHSEEDQERAADVLQLQQVGGADDQRHAHQVGPGQIHG